MQRTRRIVNGAMATGFLALVGVTAATTAVHLRLTASHPAADEVLPGAPDTVRLWFSEAPEQSLSAIGIEGAQGRIELGDVEATDDPTSIKAQVKGELPPGDYGVTWRAAGLDGHVVRGSYEFTVAVDRPNR
jgi:methionine-rich copper-binding protein CopC